MRNINANFLRKLCYSIAFLGLLLSSNFAFAAPKTASASGNWGTAGTWTPAGVPAAGDDVTIPAGFTVTLGANVTAANGPLSVTVNGTLTIGPAFKLNTQNVTTATITNNGTINIGTTTSGITFTNGGSFVNNGAFVGAAANTGTITNTAGTLIISGTTAISIPAMVVTAGTVTNIINTGTGITFIGTTTPLTGAGTFRNGNGVVAGVVTFGTAAGNTASTITTFTNDVNSTLNVVSATAAAFNPGTLNATAAGNTVNYNFGGAQTIEPAASYFNLGLGVSGAKTLAGTTTTVAGLLTMSGSATITAPASLVNIGTPATAGTGISISGTASYTGAAATIYKDITVTGGTLVPGNFVHQVRGNVSITGGAYTTGTGTLNFNHTAAQTINITVPITIGTVSMNNTVGVTNLATSTGLTVSTSLNSTVAASNTFTNAGTLIVTGTVANATAGSTLNLLNSGTATLSGTTTAATGTVAITNNATGILNVNNGTFTPTTLTANAVGNLVNYQFAGAQTIKASAGNVYHHLSITGAGTKTSATALTINGNVLISNLPATASVFATGANAINVRGNWTNNSSAASGFTGTGLVTFDGTSAQTLGGAASTTFTNLNASTTGATPTLTSGNIAVSGTLTVAGTTTFIPAAAATVISGAGTITGTGTIQVLNATSYATQYTITTSTLTNLTVNYAAAGAQNITHAGTIGTLVTSNGGTKTLTSNVTVGTGGVIIGGGTTYASNAFTLTIAGGNLANNGTFTPANGTVAFTSAAAQQFTGFSVPSLNSLTLNGAGGVTLTTTNINLNGTLTLTNGKLTTGANKVTAANGATVPTGSAASHVVGNFEHNITSATAKNYPLGDGTVSLPLTLTPTTITTGGTILAKVTAGDEINIATSGLDNTKATKNFWTLTNTGGANINYDLNLNFGANIDAGAPTANFYAAIYNGSAWHNPLSYGAKNATNTTVTGLSTGSDMGDIQLGAAAPPTASTPANVTTCEGTNAVFTTTASGISPLSYMWFRNGSATPLANGPSNGASVISGSATNTLTITAVDTLDEATNYYVVVTDGTAQTVQSGNATLTVNRLPRISAGGQPAVSQHVCEGNAFNLTVTPHGTGPFMYEWFKNATSLGAPSASPNFTIPAVTLADASNTYYVQVTGTCSPGVNSNFATLLVDTTTAITAQPTASQHVCEGTNITLTVTAAGTAKTYQWYKGTPGPATMLTDGGRINGSTTNTLIISNAVYTDSDNNYTVVVGGTCTPTSITSNPAAVIVDSVPAITGNPVALQHACEGTPFNLTVAATGTGLMYEWFNHNVSTGAPSTSPNFTIGFVALSDSSNSYFVKVTGTCGTAVNSNFATLVVDTANSITTPPASSQQCENTSLSLNVVAKGSAKIYKWYRNSGTLITDGGNISGATTSTLKINPLTTADAFNDYNVVVSGTCASATSGFANVIVDAAPKITTQPVDTSKVCENSMFSISVTATGAGVMNGTYQWSKNGSPIAGATNSTYSIASVTPADAGTYTVVVNGTCSVAPNIAATSTNSVLIVNLATAITSQPTPPAGTPCEGISYSLSVGAVGGGLTYQWYRNGGMPVTGTNVTGANTATLTLNPLLQADAFNDYYVIVTGNCAPLTKQSNNVNVTVNPGSVINTQPAASQTVCDSSSVSLTVSATAAGTISYQWFRNGSGTALTDGGHISGATTATLTINPAVSGQDDFNNYYVKVYNTAGCAPAQSKNDTIVINTKPRIVTNARDTAVCQGDTAVFKVTTSGTALTYQWLRNGSAISNGAKYSGIATNTLKIANADSAADNGSKYSLAIVNTGCSAVSSFPAATLTVNTPITITTQPTDSIVECQGDTVKFTVAASGSNLKYQWRRNGVVLTNSAAIAGATSKILTLNGIALADSGHYSVIVSNGGCAAQTSNLTKGKLVVNSPAVITTAPIVNNGCEGDTIQYTVVASGSGLTYQWFKNNVALANGSVYSGVKTSQLVVSGIDSTMNGDLFKVSISSAGCNGVTSTPVGLNVNTHPRIKTQPVAPATTPCDGSNVILTVNASGTNLTYQWRKNGIALTNGTKFSGVTTSTLTITSTVVGDAGNYDVVISGSCAPAATSNAVVLNINATAKIITEPQVTVNQCIGNPVNIFVTATGTGLTYQWRKNGINITDNTTRTGTNNDTLSFSSIAPADTGRYDVVITGTCNQVISGGSVVSVNTAPTITGQPVSQTTCEGNTVTFNVTATSSGSLTYQWRKNGFPLSNNSHYAGVNSATLTINTVALSDAANYDVIVGIVGCNSATSNVAELTVSPATFVGQILGSTEVCKGGNSGGVSLINYQGTILSWEKSEDNGVTWTALPANTLPTQNYTNLTVTTLFRATISSGACGNIKSDAAEIKVNEKPNVDFTYPNPVTAGVKTEFSDNSTVTGGTVTNWSWNFGDGNLSTLKIATNTYAKEGNYKVTLVVTSNKGCVDSTTKPITVVAGQTIFISNVITQDDNGKNDSFYVEGIKNAEASDIKIFNRNGTEVFKASPYLNDFNGKTNGNDLPDGTYYYVLKITNGGVEKTYKGYITLLK